MKTGYLYFVKDEFYDRFGKYGLLGNKESENNTLHNRPCCYLFHLQYGENIFWMIPVSSRIEKYEKEYKKSLDKYGICDNISFGYILGNKSAFLPQNLFPIKEKYVGNVYMDKNKSEPIKIDKALMAELNAKARKKIRYNFKGRKFGMSDIVSIFRALEMEED